jgi:hypothetical protein
MVERFGGPAAPPQAAHGSPTRATLELDEADRPFALATVNADHANAEVARLRGVVENRMAKTRLLVMIERGIPPMTTTFLGLHPIKSRTHSGPHHRPRTCQHGCMGCWWPEGRTMPAVAAFGFA